MFVNHDVDDFCVCPKNTFVSNFTIDENYLGRRDLTNTLMTLSIELMYNALSKCGPCPIMVQPQYIKSSLEIKLQFKLI